MDTKSQIVGSIVIVVAVFSFLLLPTWQQSQDNRSESNEVAGVLVKTEAETPEDTMEAERVADVDKPAERSVEDAGTSATVKTIAYQDSYRTVVTFNPAQIQKVTGLPVEEASIEAIVTTFQQEETWTTLEFSADDAKLIADAASSEHDSKYRQEIDKKAGD